MQNIWKILSQLMIFALLVIAAVVFYGLIAGRNMWAWIVAYWATLTAKNAFDLIDKLKGALQYADPEYFTNE